MVFMLLLLIAALVAVQAWAVMIFVAFLAPHVSFIEPWPYSVCLVIVLLCGVLFGGSRS